MMVHKILLLGFCSCFLLLSQSVFGSTDRVLVDLTAVDNYSGGDIKREAIESRPVMHSDLCSVTSFKSTVYRNVGLVILDTPQNAQDLLLLAQYTWVKFNNEIGSILKDIQNGELVLSQDGFLVLYDIITAISRRCTCPLLYRELIFQFLLSNKDHHTLAFSYFEEFPSIKILSISESKLLQICYTIMLHSPFKLTQFFKSLPVEKLIFCLNSVICEGKGTFFDAWAYSFQAAYTDSAMSESQMSTLINVLLKSLTYDYPLREDSLAMAYSSIHRLLDWLKKSHILRKWASTLDFVMYVTDLRFPTIQKTDLPTRTNEQFRRLDSEPLFKAAINVCVITNDIKILRYILHLKPKARAKPSPFMFDQFCDKPELIKQLDLSMILRLHGDDMSYSLKSIAGRQGFKAINEYFAVNTVDGISRLKIFKASLAIFRPSDASAFMEFLQVEEDLNLLCQLVYYCGMEAKAKDSGVFLKLTLQILTHIHAIASRLSIVQNPALALDFIMIPLRLDVLQGILDDPTALIDMQLVHSIFLSFSLIRSRPITLFFSITAQDFAGLARGAHFTKFLANTRLLMNLIAVPWTEFASIFNDQTIWTEQIIPLVMELNISEQFSPESFQLLPLESLQMEKVVTGFAPITSLLSRSKLLPYLASLASCLNSNSDSLMTLWMNSNFLTFVTHAPEGVVKRLVTYGRAFELWCILAGFADSDFCDRMVKYFFAGKTTSLLVASFVHVVACYAYIIPALLRARQTHQFELTFLYNWTKILQTIPNTSGSLELLISTIGFFDMKAIFESNPSLQSLHPPLFRMLIDLSHQSTNAIEQNK